MPGSGSLKRSDKSLKQTERVLCAQLIITLVIRFLRVTL
jgi:hypothetical protein